MQILQNLISGISIGAMDAIASAVPSVILLVKPVGLMGKQVQEKG